MQSKTLLLIVSISIMLSGASIVTTQQMQSMMSKESYLFIFWTMLVAFTTIVIMLITQFTSFLLVWLKKRYFEHKNSDQPMKIKQV